VHGINDQPQAPRNAPFATRLAALDVDFESGDGGSVGRLPMLLTVRDVEAELQLGRTRTYELLRSGEIPALRIGRALRIPREALERWIDDHADLHR
jgi:excisionase family DNA binding protein